MPTVDRQPPSRGRPYAWGGPGNFAKVPGYAVAVIVGCIYFWGYFLPDPALGPTGHALFAGGGLLVAPMVIAIGFAAGWACSLLLGALAHKIERRIIVTAFVVFTLSSLFLYGLFKGFVLLSWSTSPSATNRQRQYIYDTAAKIGDISSLKRLAQNANCQPELLREISRSANRDIRYLVAQNPSTPVDVLEQLSHDGSGWVLMAVTRNRSTPASVIAYLQSPQKQEVCERAKKAEARTMNDIFKR